MDMQKIGTYIARKRKQVGYTQEELGSRLGVTAKAVSKWERGLSCPEVSLLMHLSAVLKCTVVELLGGEDANDCSSKLPSKGKCETPRRFTDAPDETVTCDLSRPLVVSPCLFGSNLEHTRSSVFGGLSAQMLKNRKFVGKPSAMRGIAACWYPIGEASYFALKGDSYTHHDTVHYHMKRSFECNALLVGNLLLEEETGFGQHELALKGGDIYEFAVVLKSKTTLAVTVSLTSRGGKTVYDRKTIDVRAGETWERYTLTLSAIADDDDADLRITFCSKACLFVGAVSLLPQDHFHGMRRDAVALMKEMGIRILRWPGGNFAGEYNWFDGLLPVDERAPFEAFMNLETQPHTMGYDFHEINTDDFIALCREIGAEPYLTINPAWNTPEENAAWVEYCNGDETTYYGRLRAERGHPEPYRVTLWSLGNEFGYGHMEGENSAYGYSRVALENATAMLSVDHRLTLCSSGPYPDEHWTRYSAKPLSRVAPLVSLHYYGTMPSFADPDALEHDYETCLSSIRITLDHIRETRAQLGTEMRISFDEWNVWYAWYRPSNLIDGMYAAMILHLFIGEAHTAGIDIVCQFETVNEGSILLTPHTASLTAAGQIFSVMSRHAGGILRYASPCAVVTDHEGKRCVTLINPSYNREGRFRLPKEGEIMRAENYVGETIVPHSVFSMRELLIDENEDYRVLRLPEHSVAYLEFRM